jgi:hypothetical protein
MRAFLSHSSADKAIVVGVQSELEPDSTWLDRAEIEWGDLFLEKIAEGRLATLPMPTLLFHGLRDVLPAAFAERAASLIPRSRVVMLDAGHFIPLDRPEDVAANLRSFFAENHTTMDVAIRTRKNRNPGAYARIKSAEMSLSPLYCCPRTSRMGGPTNPRSS